MWNSNSPHFSGARDCWRWFSSRIFNPAHNTSRKYFVCFSKLNRTAIISADTQFSSPAIFSHWLEYFTSSASIRHRVEQKSSEKHTTGWYCVHLAVRNNTETIYIALCHCWSGKINGIFIFFSYKSCFCLLLTLWKNKRCLRESASSLLTWVLCVAYICELWASEFSVHHQHRAAATDQVWATNICDVRCRPSTQRAQLLRWVIFSGHRIARRVNRTI